MCVCVFPLLLPDFGNRWLHIPIPRLYKYLVSTRKNICWTNKKKKVNKITISFNGQYFLFLLTYYPFVLSPICIYQIQYFSNKFIPLYFYWWPIILNLFIKAMEPAPIKINKSLYVYVSVIYINIYINICSTS